MSFRKGDLFVAACVLVAVGSMASMFLSTGGPSHYVTRYVVSPLGELGQSVSDWWHAPTRAQLMAKITSTEAVNQQVLAACQRQVSVAEQERDQAIEADRRNQQVLDAAKAQIAVAEGERDRLFAELASLRSRHATLCQQLLELGNDVPSVLAGE